jgi:hypothetical protein
LQAALEEMLPNVTERVQKESHKQHTEGETSWQQKVQHEFTKGSGLAHRVSKPQDHLVLPLFGKQGSTAISDLLKEHEAVWHDWWQVKATPPQGDFHDIRTTMAPMLTAAELRAAARTFKKGTAQVDGWKPGHIGELTGVALQVLGHLLQLTEVVGQYPPSGLYVLTTLIPKADGGLRPIIFRLHSRCRSGILKVWARTHGRHPSVNMAAGRHTNDSLYRLLVTEQGP